MIWLYIVWTLAIFWGGYVFSRKSLAKRNPESSEKALAQKYSLKLSSVKNPPLSRVSSQRARLYKRALIAFLIILTGAFLISPIAGILAGGLVWVVFWFSKRQPQDTDFSKELPDLVDLFTSAIYGGLTIRLALETVVEKVSPDILPQSHEILSTVLDRVRAGEPLTQALSQMPPALGLLSWPLIESERYGTELGPALQRVGFEARETRRRTAETAARKVPVKMLFPLVVCILPAFGFLTLVPILVHSLTILTA